MATDIDTYMAAAQVYADSLLSLATEAGKADEIGSELADLKELWNREEDFAALMRSAAIDDDARADAIRKVFSGKVSPLVLNTLLVLNHKRRSMILPWVCDAYRKKLDSQHGREDVFVTTATPLDDAQRDQIRTQVRRLSGREAVLVEKVDPDVLGGLMVQVGDRLFDMTIRRRLRDMRAQLFTSSDRILRTGMSRFVTEG